MMLSSLRIASRRAAVARNFAAVRAASSWANVPQGPPVSFADLHDSLQLQTWKLLLLVLVLCCCATRPG
jgi:hypothetical protein